MAKSNYTNNVSVCGYVFSHALRTAKNKNNENVIFGAVNIATDDDSINVIPVNFYVREKTKAGKQNATYANLYQILSEGQTVETVGNESAFRVRVDGNIDVNDFYNRDGQLVTTQRVSGSFLHFLNANEPIETPNTSASSFEADVLIPMVTEKETNDGSTYVSLAGFAFNYRGGLVPITLSVESDSGKDFFLNEDISSSNPYFGKVWGKIKTSVVVSTHEEDGTKAAFGAPRVRETSRSFRIWEVTGANTNDGIGPDTITREELEAASNDRGAHLAELAERAGQRNAPAATGFSAAAPAQTAPTPTPVSNAAATNYENYNF